jgi:diguanylate cyclase (GGDEF)-like protein
MEALTDLFSPLSVAILFLAVFSVFAAIAAGRRRRHRWIREMAELERAEGREEATQIRRVRRELQANDFMSGAIRRVYYLVTILAAVALLLLPFLSIEPRVGKSVKLALTFTTFLSALALLAYWRGSDDEREGLLRRKLRQAQERAHASRGLAVRDEMTGAYTLDFWLHVQELRTRRFVWREQLVTCVMFDVEGLPELRARRGSEVGDEALVRVGQEILRNVRPRDLVARYRGQRFVIALDNCPAELGKRVGEKIAVNIERLTLAGTNKRYGSNLGLQWNSACIPQDASTPIQLLRVTETTLDLKKSLIPHVSSPMGQAALRSRRANTDQAGG